LIIEAASPEVRQIHNCECEVGRRSIQAFEFKNPLAEFAIFNFTSSDEEVMRIRTNKIAFEGGEARNVTVDLAPSTQQGQREVLLYINDEHAAVAKCEMIRIKYIA
jgi:hypothetical protein